MSFNTDEIVAPSWMDEKYFEKVLISSEANKLIKVSAIDVKPATKVGEHFASIIFRVMITYTDGKSSDAIQKSVILKTTPQQEGVKKEFLTGFTLFENEIEMYSNVLDPMARLLKESGETFTLAPTLLYHASDPSPVMVFDDLVDQGYGMYGKLLDLQPALLTYQRLAKFHATSLFMNENGYDLTDFKPPGSNPTADKVFQENFDAFIEVLNEWPNCQVYADKFKKFREDYSSIGKSLYTSNKGSDAFNVLTHCDFQYKNIMVKLNDNGQFDDFILLDYQVCNWSSPALDILFGFYLMVDSKTRINHRDEIVSHYYKEFVATLKQLGYLGKIPTLIDLKIELTKKGQMEASLSVCLLPFLFVDFSKFKVEDFFDLNQTEMKKSFFRNEEYKAVMELELPRMLHKGFLN